MLLQRGVHIRLGLHLDEGLASGLPAVILTQENAPGTSNYLTILEELAQIHLGCLPRQTADLKITTVMKNCSLKYNSKNHTLITEGSSVLSLSIFNRVDQIFWNTQNVNL